jgi:hypothetical protein
LICVVLISATVTLLIRIVPTLATGALVWLIPGASGKRIPAATATAMDRFTSHLTFRRVVAVPPRRPLIGN